MPYKLDDVGVLVVEDVPGMLSVTTSIMGIFGFREIIGARNGEEGFELFKKHDPDLVITDWLMEPVDGLEMIHKIRVDKDSPNPYVPVILMTGYSDKFRVEAARDKGITEFLVKPYTSRDLYNRIVQVIEKPRQFVDAGDFFGPDRRRKRNFHYEGPSRRDADAEIEQSESEKKVAADILRKLRDDAKKI